MYGGNPLDNLSNSVNQMALNVAATSIANKDAYKYSKLYADYTNNINLQNWKMQNQRTDWLNRNSALIQKQALRDAGVSAAVLDDAEFSNSVSDVGSTAAAMQGHGVSVPDLLGYSMQRRQLDIQQQLADAEVSLKAAQEKQALANAGFTSEQQITQQKVNQYYDRLANLNIAEKGAIIGNAEAQKKYTEDKNKREDAYLSLQKNLNEKELAQIDANINKINQEIKVGIAQAFKLYAEGKVAQAQEKYTDAMALGQKYVNQGLRNEYQLNGQTVRGYDIPNMVHLYDVDLRQQSVDVAIEQAKIHRDEVDHKILYDWSNFAVDTAQKVSQESRKWAYGWIPLTQ